MKLSEKILFCRKKSGLSQEALADKIGVSRQAVSKWETGETVPETGKVLLLAKTFHVTADWLLSEGESEPEVQEFEHDKTCQDSAVDYNTNWVESIPGVIGKLLRRYGWLVGVQMALAGLGFSVLGVLARILSRIILSSDPLGTGFGFDIFNTAGAGSGTIWYDEAGKVISNPFETQASSFAANNPVAIMGTVIMAIGILMIIAGVILAVYLKKRGNKTKA